MENEKIFRMKFSKVYPLLIAKAERKGRTKEEVYMVTRWLTGYSDTQLDALIGSDITYGAFFESAPMLNPDRKLIKGSVCGTKIEEIQDTLMQEIRYLDKLVDELAKGKAMEKILRKSADPKPVSLWKCPKCGREFKNKGQEHYCGDKPKTINEYILRQDDDKQEDLRYIYLTLREALPEVEERISWGMPTFWNGHNILHFAAAKKHIGLYPGPEAVKEFSEELREYKTDKGTIRIPYGKVDAMLVKRIAKWCLETGNHA